MFSRCERGGRRWGTRLRSRLGPAVALPAVVALGTGCTLLPPPYGSPPPPPPPSAPSPTPALPGGPTHLIFDDEFNGTSLSSTWGTCWWYSPVPSGCSNGSHEGEWYTPANVTEADGTLSLTARNTPVQGVTMNTDQPRTYDWTSGMVDTRETFSFSYGYVEWRASVPSGQGLWPALWLLPYPGGPPEIDALETIGQSDVGYFTYHMPSGAQQSTPVTIPGLAGGYHTFGVDWEPGSVTWYVDGRQVSQATQSVTNVPMYLIMDLAVGGNWPGYPNASTVFPATFSIDYVRVWQH